MLADLFFVVFVAFLSLIGFFAATSFLWIPGRLWLIRKRVSLNTTIGTIIDYEKRGGGPHDIVMHYPIVEYIHSEYGKQKVTSTVDYFRWSLPVGQRVRFYYNVEDPRDIYIPWRNQRLIGKCYTLFFCTACTFMGGFILYGITFPIVLEFLEDLLVHF